MRRAGNHHVRHLWRRALGCHAHARLHGCASFHRCSTCRHRPTRRRCGSFLPSAALSRCVDLSGLQRKESGAGARCAPFPRFFAPVWRVRHGALVWYTREGPFVCRGFVLVAQRTQLLPSVSSVLNSMVANSVRARSPGPALQLEARRCVRVCVCACVRACVCKSES